MNFEQDVLENKLNEQEIIRQSLDEKNKKIWELEKRIELLEGFLSRVSAVQQRLPVPQPLPAIRNVPKRWAVK